MNPGGENGHSLFCLGLALRSMIELGLYDSVPSECTPV